MDKICYGFNSCFGDEKGINLEELIVVVYVGCFIMVLLVKFGEVGFILILLDIEVKVDLLLEGGL